MFGGKVRQEYPAFPVVGHRIDPRDFPVAGWVFARMAMARRLHESGATGNRVDRRMNKQDQGVGTSTRPERMPETPLPPLPEVDKSKSEEASVEYSQYRTRLSRHRTGLSEHRTDLSEFRTDLSSHRTDLSENRTELSMRRTSMSLQRTRMSADRTLMSVIRTSLSLIGFGFTLYQAFAKLRDAALIHNATAPRNFGLALILLGSFLLVGGIWGHVSFAMSLRHIRQILIDDRLIHKDGSFPISIVLLTAISLLAIGVLAFISIIFDLSLFG